MKYLGIDYGTKRIGLAVSDEEGKIAFPRITIAADSSAIGEIDALVKKEKIGTIVLGESLNLRGQPNAVMGEIEQMKKDLVEHCGVPVLYELELFSSAAAARQFTPEEKSRKANPSQENLDASAAALILQSHLDRTNK